jgi:hypothetical protein
MHPKVLLYHRVDPLGLTVSLRMEGGRESSIDSETAAEASPEVCGELRSSIQDDGQRQSMQFEHMLQEQIGETLGINC